MANKVKYGLKNVYYAVATIDANNEATYGTPKPIKGAVNLSLDAQGDVTKFRADNIDYWIGQANNGYQGDLEVALIPDDFRVDVLGDILDSNGIYVENQDAPTVYFAFMFQFEGDEKATRHVLYKCSASRPSVAGATTEETIEPQTETLTITAASIHNAALDKELVKARCLSDNVNYATWFDAVYQSTATPLVWFSVAFDVDGGSYVSPQNVLSGGKATEPDAPTKESYTFDDWYTEDTFVNVYDFDTAVTANIILYAKWV